MSRGLDQFSQPFSKRVTEIANAFDIDITDFLRRARCRRNVSCQHREDEALIIDVPITEERNNQTYYVTIPLGLSLPKRRLLPVWKSFLYWIFLSIDGCVISILSCVLALFFQILYRNAELYLTALRSIDRKSEQMKVNCTNSLAMKN